VLIFTALVLGACYGAMLLIAAAITLAVLIIRKCRTATRHLARSAKARNRAQSEDEYASARTR
jgi:hypothetical protein